MAALKVGIGRCRMEAKRQIQGAQGFVVALEKEQCIGALEQRLEMLRLDRERLIEALKRVLIALERNQGAAAQVPQCGLSGPQCCGLIVARPRLFMAIKAAE